MNFNFPGDALMEGYLRWTGKRHLLPLFRSLKHAGRPAEIAFPEELVEQGLSVLLAGLNNTLIVQGNPAWVWPWWAERQIDPDSAAFIPTGTNVIMHNLTARNWMSLGAEGSQREAMIDPAGMVTLRPYGWSFFPYLRVDGVNFLPPRLNGTRQELLEGTLPAVRTLYDARPDIEWSSECVAMRDAGRAAQESLLCTHRLRNRSERPLKLVFGVALRPCNPLMFSPVESLRWQEGRLFVNDRAGLCLPERPDRVVISNRERGDSLPHADRGEAASEGRTYKAKSGVLAAAAEYDLTLHPGDSRAIPSLGVVDRGNQAVFALPSRRELEAAREAELDRLRAAETHGMQIDVPDPSLMRAWKAVKGRLHVFDDGDRFSPGAFLYHGHWFRDTAFIALGFDHAGFGDRVAPKLAEFFRRQDRRGFFRSQNGEWDSNGQALWTFIGHIQRGGDPALLDRHWPALMRGARWIDAMRRKDRDSGLPHAGLLPAGFSAEHFGPNDHYYWDNLWSVAGLEKMLWAARLLDRARDGDVLARSINEYRADLEASMHDAFRRTGGEGLPCSPYRGMDSAAVGNLVGLSPLDVVSPGAEWVAGTMEHLVHNNLRDGLFLQKIIHTGLNPYLSAQFARAMLRRQDPMAFGIIESLIRHGGPTLTWPEAMHPRTLGGCMGDGDHGWAAAEFLSLTRELLVREEDGNLLLLSGTPERWFRPGARIGVTCAPTSQGTATFHVEVSDEAVRVDWNVSRKPHQETGGLVLCLPLRFGRSLGIPGEAWGPHLRIRLPVNSGQLRLGERNSSGEPLFPEPQRSIHAPTHP